MEKKLKLLSRFDDKYKGVALNAILYFVRNGGHRPHDAITEIQNGIEKIKRQNEKWGNGELQGTNAQWDWYFKTVDYNEQESDFEEAVKYAKEWEAKTPEEKQKIKDEQAEFFKKQSMKGKPATEAQIKFLEARGISIWNTERDNPIERDRFECSEIIDKLMKGL